MKLTLLLTLLVGIGLPCIARVEPPAAEAVAVAKGVLEAARAKGKTVAEARRAHLAAGLQARDFKADCSKELAEIGARLATEKAADVRQALLVSRLYLIMLTRQEPSAEQVAQTLKEVPATSGAWTLEPGLLSALAEWAPAASASYLAEARAKHPDGPTRRNLLLDYFWEAVDAKNPAAYQPAFDMLQKDFPGSKETLQAAAILESERKTAIGSLAPAFSMPALEDKAVLYSLDTFKGQYLLMDFWATWCGPCRAEMPVMHKAWARFGGNPKFAMLSLSFDRKIEHIAPFRKQGGTPMPWKHTFVDGGFNSPIGQAYGVKGIPKPLLISPEGRIVASGGELRGENLEKTLAKFLNK
jgi:thiol-disulfide isomerase/thioredoxin